MRQWWRESPSCPGVLECLFDKQNHGRRFLLILLSLTTSSYIMRRNSSPALKDGLATVHTCVSANGHPGLFVHLQHLVMQPCQGFGSSSEYTSSGPYIRLPPCYTLLDPSSHSAGYRAPKRLGSAISSFGVSALHWSSLLASRCRFPRHAGNGNSTATRPRWSEASCNERKRVGEQLATVGVNI